MSDLVRNAMVNTKIKMEVRKPACRLNKRREILERLVEHAGVRMSSEALRTHFGSGFRARVPELNRAPGCPVVIKDHVHFVNCTESSVYWAEPKARPAVSQMVVFGDPESSTHPIINASRAIQV